MSKKHSGLMEEIDLQEVTGYTEAQKSNYLSLGYKPFRGSSGNIKWLSPQVHSLRINHKKRRTLFQRLFTVTRQQVPNRKKHRPTLLKFIKVNWMFLAMVLVIGSIVLALMLYPHIILGVK